MINIGDEVIVFDDNWKIERKTTDGYVLSFVSENYSGSFSFFDGFSKQEIIVSEENMESIVRSTNIKKGLPTNSSALTPEEEYDNWINSLSPGDIIHFQNDDAVLRMRIVDPKPGYGVPTAYEFAILKDGELSDEQKLKLIDRRVYRADNPWTPNTNMVIESPLFVPRGGPVYTDDKFIAVTEEELMLNTLIDDINTDPIYDKSDTTKWPQEALANVKNIYANELKKAKDDRSALVASSKKRAEQKAKKQAKSVYNPPKREDLDQDVLDKLNSISDKIIVTMEKDKELDFSKVLKEDPKFKLVPEVDYVYDLLDKDEIKTPKSLKEEIEFMINELVDLMQYESIVMQIPGDNHQYIFRTTHGVGDDEEGRAMDVALSILLNDDMAKTLGVKDIKFA